MPPKKGGKDAKKGKEKKVEKPAWMSDELYVRDCTPRRIPDRCSASSLFLVSDLQESIP